MQGIKDIFGKVLKPWWGKVVFVVVVLVAVSWVLATVNVKATAEQVAKIHATKLTMDDVMGKNFPPDPGVEADKTIAGIDANKNGIRDDVELAIFKEYPNSAKTRAVLLQYALALQMEMVQPVVNRDTVTAVAEQTSRGGDCIADTLVPRKTPESAREYEDLEKINSFAFFVEKIQLNTEQRRIAQRNFYKGNLGSYELSSGCDLEISLLD